MEVGRRGRRGRAADASRLRRAGPADRAGPGQRLNAGDAVEGQMDQRARAWFGTWTGLGQALRDRAGGEVSAQVVRVVLVELRQSAREHRLTDEPPADGGDDGVDLLEV